MKLPFTGGCLCGAIRYECSAEPVMAEHCQCLDCQKQSGTGHASGMLVPKGALKITGTAKYYETKADSGNTVARGFCPNCGIPVFSRSTGMQDMTFLVVGSLDDPSEFRPGMVVYTSCAQPWDVVDPALPRFPKMPPM